MFLSKRDFSFFTSSSLTSLLSLTFTSLSMLAFVSSAFSCSDREYSISISKFVQCVENNFIQLSDLEDEQSELKMKEGPKQGRYLAPWSAI